MNKLSDALRSSAFFYSIVGLFIAASAWIAFASIYPMAFDEEFHYGLIKIYATSLLPYGIEHTSDMAQFGAATADASYLFHYIMSFPYRLLHIFGLSDTAIIVILRLCNIAFVAAALIVFRNAFKRAGVSDAVSNIGLLSVTLIPIFPLLAAHINYDNLLLLLFAWCVYSLVVITNSVQTGQPLPLSSSFQLIVAVLLGMSVKYAFLPLALGMFIWLIWLLVVGYRHHSQTINSQLRSYRRELQALSGRRQLRMTLISLACLFFVAHYAVNMLSYGSPIPSCERVFSETECAAYGPWNRNKNMEARKSESFEPMSYPIYMAREWLPGMTQRLTFAVAGKTNGFETKLPLPAVVYSFVTVTIVGVACLIWQAARRKSSWLASFTALLSLIYAGVLSFQLYGDYVDTAEPVAINGRYLIPLLPLVAVILIRSIRETLYMVSSASLSLLTVGIIGLFLVSGAGISTYIILAESHWLWPGFGQESHAFVKPLFERSVLPYRY